MAIFGINAFVSGLLILMLPETLGKELPATIQDALDLSLSASPAEHAHENVRTVLPIILVDEATSADETVTEEEEESADEDDPRVDQDDTSAIIAVSS